MTHPDATPTPPSPEPPREREGERGMRYETERLQRTLDEVVRYLIEGLFTTTHPRGYVEWAQDVRRDLWKIKSRLAAASLPPREREGEPCDICGRTKAMHQGPERFCPIIASYRAASLPPSAGTRETDQRFDDPVEQIIATLEGGPTVAAARKPLALRITHAIHLLRKLHPKSAPPSAGTMEPVRVIADTYKQTTTESEHGAGGSEAPESAGQDEPADRAASVGSGSPVREVRAEGRDEALQPRRDGSGGTVPVVRSGEVLADRVAAPPSAGSGETELDRLTAYIAGFIEAIDAKPDDDGYAEAVAHATETASAWLAAHPAGTTRETEITVPRAEIEALRTKAAAYERINTPELFAFVSAVENEALHQRERWGIDADGGKTDADWFWLIGYLAGKALHNPPKDGMPPLEAQLHRIVTVAAAAANWHAAVMGVYARMRPGIDPPAETPP